MQLSFNTIKLFYTRIYIIEIIVDFVKNIIKLSDIPFSYSFIGLILFQAVFKVNTKDISTIGPLLLLIGIFGTTLSITHPFGYLTKQICKKYRFNYYNTIDEFIEPKEELSFQPDRYKKFKEIDLQKRYSAVIEGVLNKNWVTFESDKIVSIFYFLVILIVFLIVINMTIFYQIL